MSYYTNESLPGGAKQYLCVSAQWSGRTSATPHGDVTEKSGWDEAYGRGALAIYHNTGKNSARPDGRSAQGPGEGVKWSMCTSEEHRRAKHVFSMNCGRSQAARAPWWGLRSGSGFVFPLGGSCAGFVDSLRLCAAPHGTCDNVSGSALVRP